MRTHTDSRGLIGRESAEVRFRRLYAEHGRAVLAYAVRRCGDPQDAADVVAETFLVAWRRFADVPAGEEAKLWLYGVARRVLANQHRAVSRRNRLAERLREELPTALQAVSDPPAADRAVLQALRELSDDDREILLLAAWEQLEPVEIAHVLGISRVAVRSRLHRARSRLRARLTDGDCVATGSPLYEEAR
jgi:RNA polymerase sigma-70 factor, ECF subfamily